MTLHKSREYDVASEPRIIDVAHLLVLPWHLDLEMTTWHIACVTDVAEMSCCAGVALTYMVDNDVKCGPIQ